jgi:hypothetical protein
VHTYWTANTVVDPATGLALDYAQLKLGPVAHQWIQGATNKISRLAQGSRHALWQQDHPFYPQISHAP